MQAGKKEKKGEVYVPTCLAACIGITILLLTLTGAGVMATSLYLKVLYSNLDDLHFHLWVSIPVIAVALLGFAAAFAKRLTLYAALFTITFLVFVISTYGAITTGLAFHENNFRGLYEDLSDNKCTDGKSGGCNCPSDVIRPQEVKDLNCEDLEIYTKLLIADITLSAISSLCCVLIIILSMAAIWCRPWVHLGTPEVSDKKGMINQDFENEVTITRNTQIDSFNGQFNR